MANALRNFLGSLLELPAITIFIRQLSAVDSPFTFVELVNVTVSTYTVLNNTRNGASTWCPTEYSCGLFVLLDCLFFV